MRILVPFSERNPKSRLETILTDEERQSFARAMLADVLCAILDADGEPVLLADGPVDVPVDGDVEVRIDDRPLTPAVNAALADEPRPVAIIVADIPLVTTTALRRFFDTAGDVVLAPGLGGGTNAILTRTNDFLVDYHEGSYTKHRSAARDHGLDVRMFDSFRIALDIDEPGDVAEILLHTDGRSAAWLTDAGFELEIDAGRVTVSRPAHEKTDR